MSLHNISCKFVRDGIVRRIKLKQSSTFLWDFSQNSVANSVGVSCYRTTFIQLLKATIYYWRSKM